MDVHACSAAEPREPGRPSAGASSLPRSMLRGPLGSVDRYTTVVAVLTFAFHYLLVAAIYSDWADPLYDDVVSVNAVVESLAQLPAPPALDSSRLSDDGAAAAATAEPSEAAKRGPPDGKANGSSTHAPGRSGASGGDVDGRVLDLAGELAAADIATVAALGSDGVATQGVVGDGQTPARWLDELGASERGTRRGNDFGLDLDGSSGGPIVPGATRRRGLDQIARTRREGREQGKEGEVDGPVVPKGTAQPAPPTVTGDVPNAARVVAGLKGQFRHCYQRQLPTHPEMEGSVLLVARIGENGEVLSVGGGGGVLAPIVPCLKAAVGGAQFAPPKSGAAVLQIPVTFRLQR